jgi:hypothetical protein
VLCRGCEYNLRGVAIQGRCPECNHDNREALLPNDLQFMDARWLGRVLMGLRIAFVGMCMGWALAGAFLLSFPGLQMIAHERLRLAVAVCLGISVLGWFAILAGIAVAAPPNRLIENSAGVRQVRLCARWSALALVSVSVHSIWSAMSARFVPPGTLVWIDLLGGWLLLVLLGYSLPAWLSCLHAHDREDGPDLMTPTLRILLPAALAMFGLAVACMATDLLIGLGGLIAIVVWIALPVGVLLLMIELWHATGRVQRAYQLRCGTASPATR